MLVVLLFRRVCYASDRSSDLIVPCAGKNRTVRIVETIFHANRHRLTFRPTNGNDAERPSYVYRFVCNSYRWRRRSGLIYCQAIIGLVSLRYNMTRPPTVFGRKRFCWCCLRKLLRFHWPTHRYNRTKYIHMLSVGKILTIPQWRH